MLVNYSDYRSYHISDANGFGLYERFGTSNILKRILDDIVSYIENMIIKNENHSIYKISEEYTTY